MRHSAVSSKLKASAKRKDELVWTPPAEPVALSPSVEFAVLDTIEATVRFVLDSVGTSASVIADWKRASRHGGAKFFEDHTLRQAPAQPARYCCVEESSAGVEELMSAFVGVDNETLQQNARILHSNVVDTRLLALLKAPCAEKPFRSTYVKYTRVRGPRSALWPAGRRDRDMCAVVATDCVALRDGATMGYCLWDSVELGDELCPDLSNAANKARESVQRTRMARSGYVLHNSGDAPDAPTKIVYFCGLQHDMDWRTGGAAAIDRAPASSVSLCSVGGASTSTSTISRVRELSVSMEQHMSSSVSFHALDRLGGSAKRLSAHFRRKALNVQEFAPRREWATPARAAYCCSCHHTFTLLSRRFNCSACGEVMCRTCCRKEVVDVPGVGLQSMRICAYCVQGLDDSHRASYYSHLRSTTTTTSRAGGGGGGGQGNGDRLTSTGKWSSTSHGYRSGGDGFHTDSSGNSTDNEEYDYYSSQLNGRHTYIGFAHAR